MQGDRLARGGRSATFPPAKVSQAKWDEIFKAEPKEIKAVKKVKQDGKQSSE